MRTFQISAVVAVFSLTGIIECAAQVISIQDSRPVSELAWQLEEKYGVAISYEDPPYLCSDDVIDVSAEVNRSASPPETPVLIPREEAIDFKPISVHKGSAESFEKAFRASLDKYAAASGRKFAVSRHGEMLIVVPANYRSKDGTFEQADPIFDKKISIAPGKRTGIEFLQEFSKALLKASGSKVSIGTIPINLFFGAHTELQATDMRARDVLLSLFAETHQQLSWQLLYGPGEGDYALNIRVVPKTAHQT